VKDIRRNEVCRMDVEGEGAGKILGVMGDERKRRQEEEVKEKEEKRRERWCGK